MYSISILSFILIPFWKIVPLGASTTFEYFIFQKKNLQGLKFSFIFFTLKLLSKINTSIGNLTPNVCIPNIVLKYTVIGVFLNAIPIVFSL